MNQQNVDELYNQNYQVMSSFSRGDTMRKLNIFQPLVVKIGVPPEALIQQWKALRTSVGPNGDRVRQLSNANNETQKLTEKAK
jgi:hypothetical protein